MLTKQTALSLDSDLSAGWPLSSLRTTGPVVTEVRESRWDVDVSYKLNLIQFGEDLFVNISSTHSITTGKRHASRT